MRLFSSGAFVNALAEWNRQDSSFTLTEFHELKPGLILAIETDTEGGTDFMPMPAFFYDSRYWTISNRAQQDNADLEAAAREAVYGLVGVLSWDEIFDPGTLYTSRNQLAILFRIADTIFSPLQDIPMLCDDMLEGDIEGLFPRAAEVAA